jgi:hypothetical protein
MRINATALGTALIVGSATFSVPLATADSFSPWGDSGYGSGDATGRGDFAGDGTGEGEAEFGMDFKGRSRSQGNFRGDGDTSWRGNAYGYDSNPYYYGGYGPYGGAPGYGAAPTYGGGAPWGGWRPPMPPQGPWGAPPSYPQQQPPRAPGPAAPAGR